MLGRPKGHPKSGGRQKGTPNKASAKREAEIAASGLTPLDYMLTVMRNEKADEGMRLEAAKAAAPFVHPKLSNVEMNANVNDTTPRDAGEAVARINRVVERYGARGPGESVAGDASGRGGAGTGKPH